MRAGYEMRLLAFVDASSAKTLMSVHDKPISGKMQLCFAK